MPGVASPCGCFVTLTSLKTTSELKSWLQSLLLVHQLSVSQCVLRACSVCVLLGCNCAAFRGIYGPGDI